MNVLKLFLFLSLFFPGLYSATDCEISRCDYYGVPVRFPFQLSPQQPQGCGFPGYNLRCNSDHITVLNLPSGDFLVRSINYGTQVIKLYDPYKCLATRLLELNLSGSPFKAANYQNYTFLDCPPASTSSSITTIKCLSNSTSTIIATSSPANPLTTCKIMFASTIPVPLPQQFDAVFLSDLNDDLELTWSIPNCDHCEEYGGLCKLKNSTSREPTCSNMPKTGVHHVMKVIALCITLPVIITSLVIASIICFTSGPDQAHRNAAVASESIDCTQQQGLDESTIESYTKVIIGESRRLPAGTNGVTCSICLSDYNAEETLKCIPECQHCFHSECIDEWLRRKGTCPVCRNSPSPSPSPSPLLVHVDSS